MRTLTVLLLVSALAAAEPSIEVLATGKIVPAGGTYHQPMNAPDANVALFSEQRDLFTVRNTGTTPLTISGISLQHDEGVVGEEFSLESESIQRAALQTEPVVLAPDGRFSFYVRFYPVHSGLRGTTLTLSCADGGQRSWRMTGSGRTSARFTNLGTVVQHQLYGGPKTDEQASGMAVDVEGNAFLLGQATGHADRFAYDLILSKVTPTGELAWSKLWHGPFRDYSRDAGQNDQTGGVADAIAVDEAGDVYFCGGVSPANSNNNFAMLVAKVRGTDGTMLWERLYRPAWPSSLLAKHSAEGYGLHVRGGRVYAVGTTGAAQSGSEAYVAVLAYDAANGDLLWQRAIDPSPGSNDRGYCVTATDQALYIAGNANNRGFLLKLDDPANPALAWAKKIDMGSGSSVHSLASGPEGEVYLACDRRGSTSHFTTLRVNPDGNLAWAKTYRGATGNQNHATAVVRVAGDRLLVGGRIAFSELDAQMGDGFVALRSLSDGALLGSMVYFTGKGPDEIQEHRVKGLALHGQDLLIFGQTYTGNNNGVRYHGYWYDGLGEDVDDPQPFTDLAIPEAQIITPAGEARDAVGARNYVDAPATLIWQPAVDKHDGQGPDEDFFFMRMTLAEPEAE